MPSAVTRPIADYELLTAADNSSVVRCRIASFVYQMHEASGRILAFGHTSLLYEITEDEAGSRGSDDGVAMLPAGRIDGGWRPGKSGASPGGVPVCCCGG
jgi:hypothetical protein